MKRTDSKRTENSKLLFELTTSELFTIRGGGKDTSEKTDTNGDFN
jgi:hypothetical protein